MNRKRRDPSRLWWIPCKFRTTSPEPANPCTEAFPRANASRKECRLKSDFCFDSRQCVVPDVAGDRFGVRRLVTALVRRLGAQSCIHRTLSESLVGSTDLARARDKGKHAIDLPSLPAYVDWRKTQF